MNRAPTQRWSSALAWPAGLAGLTVALTLLVREVIPAEKVCPDFIQFWTAGTLLASGRSPYDVAFQARIQQEYGWDKATDGVGAYDFLPYYYPPWLGLAFVPLLPLGYPAAKTCWFVLNVELLALSGYLLRRAAPGVPRSVPLTVAPIFALSVLAVLLGQVAPLVLFLGAASWRLLEARRDRSAGVVLAWLTIKPQLTVLLLVGLLVGAARRRRWRVVQGFAAGFLTLALASTLIVPSWPLEMLRAPLQTPLVTTSAPWIGATWLLLLRTLGLKRWLLGAAYGAAAVPFVGFVLKAAWERARPLTEVFAPSLLAAFFVAPYGRAYDFPILIFPLLLLLGGSLPSTWEFLLLVVFVVLPYWNWSWVGPRHPYEISFFWIPLLLAVLFALRGNMSRLDQRLNRNPS